ncbi:hypothetical protein BGW39_002024, partial [Mortierella sp. 14UC]
ESSKVTYGPGAHEDLDDVESRAEREQEQIKRKADPSNAKEPSRAHLKSIEAVTRMLLEAPTLDANITIAQVRKSFYKPDKVTEEECQAIIDVVQILREYVPKQQINSKGVSMPPTAHVANSAPVIIIANQLLRVSGYPQFCRRIAPSSSIGPLHPLPLGAASLYETLCASAPGHFDTYNERNTVISSVPKARRNAVALFSSLFDLDKIKSICARRKLTFAHRLTYVDRYTIHVLGDVIQEGDMRGTGAPVRSALDDAKRNKATKRASGTDWSREGAHIGMSQDDARAEAKMAEIELANIERQQQVRRNEYGAAEAARLKAAEEFKLTENTAGAQTGTMERGRAYDQLYRSRRVASDAHQHWASHEAEVKKQRSKVYALNRIAKTKPNPEPPPERRRTEPTWTRPTAEDKTENVFLDRIFAKEGLKTRGTFGFGSDDPGLCTLQVSATMTHGKVSNHIRHYFETANPFGVLEDYDHLGPSIISPSEDVADIPPIHRITAPLLDDLTFSKKHARSREQDLRSSNPVATTARNAHERLSTTPITTTTTLEQIETAQQIRRDVRDACRVFTFSNKRRKQAKTQRIRTSRAYATLAAAQRSKIKKEARLELQTQDMTKDPRKFPSDKADMQEQDHDHVYVLPIILHGAGGSCVGSRLKGHMKRGGRKMNKQNRQYGVVCETDEHRTSQVCSSCFEPIELARATRAEQGQVKHIRLHGAVVCRNRECPRVMAGRGTQGRDSNSAVNIAIAGASSLLSSNKTTLAPFKPFVLPA